MFVWNFELEGMKGSIFNILTKLGSLSALEREVIVLPQKGKRGDKNYTSATSDCECEIWPGEIDGKANNNFKSLFERLNSRSRKGR